MRLPLGGLSMEFKGDSRWGLYLELDTGKTFGPLLDEAEGMKQMHEYFAARIEELAERVKSLEHTCIMPIDGEEGE